MAWKEGILEQIGKGFTKGAIEYLIGLPRNSLSGGLKKEQYYSKKNVIKIERWLDGEKPDPLTFIVPKVKTVVKDLNKQINQKSAKKLLGNKKSNFTINTAKKDIPPMPIKQVGEDVFVFAARKNEWKLKYNQ